MNTSKIEWLRDPVTGKPGYTINPVKGLCPVGCSYCYARRMYKRFKWNPEISYESDAMDGCLDLPKGSKVFVGSTFELFGDWVKPEWLKSVFAVTEICPDITFIFLTKRPENLIQWSPFPDNCWVGVSTTGNDSNSGLDDIFAPIRAKVKFVSIEPLLDYSPMDFRWVKWVIVGRQTPISFKTEPRLWQIEDIIHRANDEGVPVFLKDNLKSFLDTQPLAIVYQYGSGKLRQEFPREGEK